VGSANDDGRAGSVLVGVPVIAAGASVELLVRSTLARSVAQLQEREPGVRQGDDPEDVHKFRVATRRLRSDLRTFGPLLDKRWRRGLRAGLRWLGGEVGAVRDADVLRGRIGAQVRDLPETLAGDAEPLLVRLAGERALAHAGLLDALGTTRYARLVDALVAAAEQPQLAPGPDRRLPDGRLPGGRPAAEVVAGLVREPWDDLERAVVALGDEPSDHELHEVRILTKRCRYAAEAVAPVAGDLAGRLASALADLQGVLGDHQDTVVAEAWLDRAAGHLPGTRAAADALIARQRAERHALRLAWPAAWRAAAAPDLHAGLAPG
jgi:CHAD domain-containing protein